MAATQPSLQHLPPFDPHATVGALEVGMIVSMTLFGVTCVQTYIYFRNGQKDPKLVKILVGSLWTLELANSIAICHYVYTATITDYGHPERLLFAPISYEFTILFHAFIGFIEQSWFIRRLYKFSRNLWATGVCILFALARLGFTMALDIIAFAHRPISFPAYIERWGWLILATISIGAATDVLIVSCLIYHLSRWKRRDNLKIISIIDRLILSAIETSFLTSAFSVIMLITFITMPRNFVWIGLYLMLSRVFANSMLFSLTFRESLARAFSTQGSSGMGTAPSRRMKFPTSPVRSSKTIDSYPLAITSGDSLYFTDANSPIFVPSSTLPRHGSGMIERSEDSPSHPYSDRYAEIGLAVTKEEDEGHP